MLTGVSLAEPQGRSDSVPRSSSQGLRSEKLPRKREDHKALCRRQGKRSWFSQFWKKRQASPPPPPNTLHPPPPGTSSQLLFIHGLGMGGGHRDLSKPLEGTKDPLWGWWFNCSPPRGLFQSQSSGHPEKNVCNFHRLCLRMCCGIDPPTPGLGRLQPDEWPRAGHWWHL